RGRTRRLDWRPSFRHVLVEEPGGAASETPRQPCRLHEHRAQTGRQRAAPERCASASPNLRMSYPEHESRGNAGLRSTEYPNAKGVPEQDCGRPPHRSVAPPSRAIEFGKCPPRLKPEQTAEHRVEADSRQRGPQRAAQAALGAEYYLLELLRVERQVPPRSQR